MKHTYDSISKLLAGAQDNNMNAYIHMPGTPYGLRLESVKMRKIEDREELQVLISSYQGYVWQKVISSDEFYAN